MFADNIGITTRQKGISSMKCKDVTIPTVQNNTHKDDIKLNNNVNIFCIV